VMVSWMEKQMAEKKDDKKVFCWVDLMVMR
jgi:hypothetical protein